MASTTTKNLKLKLDSNLTASAKYNLERIDLLGATFVVDTTNDLNIRSQTDIIIQPNAPALGGVGTGGDVKIGSPDQPVNNLEFNATAVSFSGALSLKDQASTSTGKLELQYKSDLTGSLDNSSRALLIDVQGADRNLILGGDVSLSGGNLSLTTTGDSSLTLPLTGTLATLAGTEVLTNKTIAAASNTITGLTNANVDAAAAISYSKLDLTTSIKNSDVSATAAIHGSKIDPDFVNQTVITRSGFRLSTGVRTLDIQGPSTGWTSDYVFHLPAGYGNVGQVLTSDGSGNMEWTNAGIGTVTSVDLSMPSEFSVSGGPITSNGTLAVSKANQSANLVYSGPSSGGAAQPTFRSLIRNDLPAGTSAREVYSWVPGDSQVKNITHSFTNTKPIVKIFDENTEEIGVGSVVVTGPNTLQLVSSEVPSGTWTVIVEG